MVVFFLLPSKLSVEVQKDDGQDESYRAKKQVKGLNLKAGRLEVRRGALLLTEAVLLHALHVVAVEELMNVSKRALKRAVG